MMEQNFKPSLCLQVFRELQEMKCKLLEDRGIARIIKGYQNDNFVEFMNEREKVITDTNEGMKERNLETHSWYKCTISRIRKLRAKSGPYITFERVSSSQDANMLTTVPLPFYEQLFCEIMLLINTHNYAMVTSLHASNNHEQDLLKQMIFAFFNEIILQFDVKNPDTDSDWFCNKIVEARTLIAKCEPALSLQSQDVGSASSINMPTMALFPLHEKLCYEIRSLIRMKCADFMIARGLTEDNDLNNEYKEEVQKQKSEVNKFLTEVNLQLQEKNLDKNSDWYHNKIAESKALIAKSYPPFPFLTRDLGYIKEEYQIFLSFTGEDTQHNFTGNLHHALNQEGFNIFMVDQGLHTSDPNEKVIIEAIENSKLSIIGFSENFADSTLHLDEVAKIVECRKKNNQLIWSIFYKVEPSDVRHQKNNYEKVMAKQETTFGKDSAKVKNWRSALSEVCGLNAYHYRENNGSEGDFLQGILKDVINIRDHLYGCGHVD